MEHDLLNPIEHIKTHKDIFKKLDLVQVMSYNYIVNATKIFNKKRKINMFINAGEAADIARVKRQTILLWLKKGIIKGIQHPAMQKTLIEKDKFVDFIRNGYWNDSKVVDSSNLAVTNK